MPGLRSAAGLPLPYRQRDAELTFYLHVGASKTASTTLQGHFFPAHPDLFFLGKEESTLRNVKRWATPEIFTVVTDINRKNMDYCLDQNTLAAALGYIRLNNGGRPIVYSYEDICEFTGPSPFEKISRFRNVFGEFGPIRIVMGVRDQVDLLKSLYLTLHRAEMLRIAGKKLSWYPTFDQYIDINFRYAYGAVLESFRFSIILDHYASIFGAENIFVYAFEDLKRDPVSMLRSLCRFMGVDENASCITETARARENQHYSARRYAYLNLRWLVVRGRSIRKLVPAGVKSRFWGWVDSGKGFNLTPSEAVIDRIREFYKVDNEVLARKYGITL